MTPAWGYGPRLLRDSEIAEARGPVVDADQIWLPIARFERLDRPRVTQDRLAWPALVSWLQQHEECAEKEDVRLWSPTLYGAKKSRANVNVVSIWALGFDFDGVEPDWERMNEWEYAAHTTFSHGVGNPAKDKPPGPYWRVIIPLAAPVPAEAWEEVWGRAHFALAPTSDAACSDVSRAYLNPSCRPDGARDARHHAGRVLDWQDLPPIPSLQEDEDLVFGTVNNDGDTWAVRPGDDFSAMATIADVVSLLEKHGAEVVREAGAMTYLRRPGKDQGGQSSSVGYRETNLFYCFSSDWPPFEGGKAYKPFAVYALLEHGGNFAAASAALRERGYGKKGGGKKDEDAERAEHLLKVAAESAENLTDFKLAVRRFLNNKKISNSQRELLADTLAEWGVEHERLLVADDGDAARPPEFLMDDDDRVIELNKDDPLIRYALDDAGVNAGNVMYAWIVNRLEAAANRRARRVKLERYVARRDGRIYLSCGPTKIVVIEAGIPELRTVRNGEDGVLFTADAVLPAWDPSAEPVDPMTLSVFQPNLEFPPETPEYTAEVQRLLLQATLVAMIGGVRPVPAMVPLGASSGGKTTLARAVVCLQRGSDGDVSTISGDKRDFDALTTRRSVVALDNLDGQAPSWFADAFATAVTGGRADTRTLYTNDDVHSKRKTAALIVTTRTANFAKRPDIVERLLPLFMVKPNVRLPDSELFGRLAEARDGVLVWLARMAAEAAARSSQAPTLPGRLVDWARTVWALDPQLGPAALAAMARAQQLAVADGDEFASKLIDYMGTHDVLEGTPKQLLKEIDKQGELPDLGGGKAIARMLRELKDGVLAQMGITVTSRRSGNATVWVIRRGATDTTPRRNGETEERDELDETPQGDHDTRVAPPRAEIHEGDRGAAPFLRFSADAPIGDVMCAGQSDSTVPALPPLSALVDEQARDAAMAVEMEEPVLDFVNHTYIPITAAQVSVSLGCRLGAATRALNTLADSHKILRNAVGFERAY